MKKLITTLFCAGAFMLSQAQTAQVMAVHNSPDPLADSVDVWLVTPSVTQKIKENFAFRTATPFLTVPSGVKITIALAGKNSKAITDTIPGLNFNYNLPANGKFILFAQGVLGNNFSPKQPFTLNVFAAAKTEFNNTKDSTAVAIYHGSTDAPGVDIELDRNKAKLTNVEYGQTTAGYLVIPSANYRIKIFAAGTSTPLVVYSAPLKNLGVNKTPLVVMASGFLDPAKNGNGKPFGLFAITADGNVLALPAITDAKVQVIHNCPDVPTAEIWLKNITDNSETKVTTVNFRKATPYLNLPVGKEIQLGVGAPGTGNFAACVWKSEPINTYGGLKVNAIAIGVLDPSKHDGDDIDFDVTGETTVDGSEYNSVGLSVIHGCTDAPSVDIGIKGGGNLIEDLSFSDIAFDGLFGNVPAQNAELEVKVAGTSTVAARFSVPFSAFKDSVLTVCASGFLTPNVPTGKDQGASFALLVVTESGRAIVLEPLTANSTKIINKEIASAYPNPVNKNFTIEFNEYQKGTFTIVNSIGAIVKTFEVNGKNTVVNMSELNNGIYYICNGDKSISIKAIVQK